MYVIKDMGKNLFVCTKPLQYFNINNIPYCDFFDKSDETVLAIVGSFDGARSFTDRVRKYDHFWNRVLYFESLDRVFLYIWTNFRIRNLILNCDLGLLTAITCSLRSFDVYTYEEGIGSYGLWYRIGSNNKYKNSILERLRIIFGNGRRMNESRWLKGCFLYYPNLFYHFRPKSHVKALPMKGSFTAQMDSRIAFYSTIFNADTSLVDTILKKNVLLYITSKNIDLSIIDEIKKKNGSYDYIIIKPHPHIINFPSLDLENCIFIKGQLMAEFLIARLLNNGNNLTIFHNNSTAVVYFQKLARVVSFGIDKDSDFIYQYVREGC